MNGVCSEDFPLRKVRFETEAMSSSKEFLQRKWNKFVASVDVNRCLEHPCSVLNALDDLERRILIWKSVLSFQRKVSQKKDEHSQPFYRSTIEILHGSCFDLVLLYVEVMRFLLLLCCADGEC